MRFWQRLIAALVVAVGAPVSAAPGIAGIWLFDHAAPNPGVTMMRVAVAGGTVSGSVTTKWYGPIAMMNAARHGDTIDFDTRNINDRARPTRHWTATVTPQGIRLVGDLWESHIDTIGRHGGSHDSVTRTFRFVPPPRLMAVAPDGLAETPPMGWSSWNGFADRIDDSTVRAVADTIVANDLRDAGYRYVNIDDGWQGTRGPDGAIRPNDRFPDMKALADYLHARGLKLGIYTSPGPRTCAGYEGSYGHVAQDARTFANWGVDYLKYDLCSGEWFYANADAVKRSYAEMGAALRATGRPILFSLCEYGRFTVADWGRSVGGHLWRTTGDITDDYAQMAKIGFDRNPTFRPGGPGGWNDPDMLEVGNGGMSRDEYATHMTLWAMSAAPLLMGNDLRKANATTLALLANRGVIAVDQDARGAQGRAVRKDDSTETWSKPLADGAVALALFNRSTLPVQMGVNAADAGLPRIGHARDLWRGADLSSVPASVTVPAHGVVLLRVAG